MICFGCYTKCNMKSRTQPSQYSVNCHDDIIEYVCPECGTTYTVYVKRGDVTKWR